MENKNYENYEDSELETLDTLIAFLDSIPKPRFKVIDKERYQTMLCTAEKLQKLLAKNNPEGVIDVGVDKDFYLGYIRTELEDLSVDDVPAFLKIVAPADHLEIYPLTKGSIRMELTFQRVFKPAEI